MILLVQNVTRQIEHFFGWWIYELGLLVPKDLRQLFSPMKPKLFIRLHNYQVFCTYSEQGIEKRQLNFYLHKEGIQQLTDFLKSHAEWQQATKILLLGPKQLLKTRVDLPLAAQDNITQVIGYELDRYTPFTTETCYFATQIAGKNLAGNRLILELFFISKPKLHHYYSTLNDLGLAPDTICHLSDEERFHISSYTLPYNLLPTTFQKNQPQNFNKLKQVLSASFLILTLIALGLPFWMQKNTLNYLQQQVAAAKKQVDEGEIIKAETNGLLQAEQKITTLKQHAPVILNMIEQLSALLPKDTWLKSFEYHNNKLTLQGLSASSSAVIALLEGSPHFGQATLVSPVTRDSQEALDKFELETTVEPTHDR